GVKTTNEGTGITNVSLRDIDAAQTMASNGLDMVLHVILPGSIPYAVTGLSLAWAFSWRALMSAELLRTGPGLGYTLSYASDFNNMSLVIGIIILIFFFLSVFDQLIFHIITHK